jgi:hypothetical protein
MGSDGEGQGAPDATTPSAPADDTAPVTVDDTDLDALVEEARVEAVDDVASAPPERHRARSIVATVLGVLTVLVLVVSVVSVWARATVLRGDKVANLVGNAIEQPEVQAALADKITAEVVNAVDLQNRVTGLLPDQLDRFAPAIAAGAERAIDRALSDVLASDRVHDTVVTLVERAHALAMRLLEGNGLSHGVTIENGVVTLNLLPLIDLGLEAVQNIGLLTNVTLPELTADGDPQQQIAELSSAIGRPLPADFGQLVVYQSDRLANAQENLQTAQRMLVFAKRAVWLSVILFVVLAAATILVAARRWRAAIVLGIGTAGAMVLLRSAVRDVVSTAPDLAARPGAKAAIRVILEGATTGLLRVAGVMLLVGLVAAAVGIMRRRRWRADLILVAAVALGVAVPAAAGLTIWSLLAGLVVGIALPFVVNWLLPARPAPTVVAAAG